MKYTDQQLLLYAFHMLESARENPKDLVKNKWLNNNVTLEHIRSRVKEIEGK